MDDERDGAVSRLTIFAAAGAGPGRTAGLCAPGPARDGFALRATTFARCVHPGVQRCAPREPSRGAGPPPRGLKSERGPRSERRSPSRRAASRGPERSPFRPSGLRPFGCPSRSPLGLNAPRGAVPLRWGGGPMRSRPLPSRAAFDLNGVGRRPRSGGSRPAAPTWRRGRGNDARPRSCAPCGRASRCARRACAAPWRWRRRRRFRPAAPRHACAGARAWTASEARGAAPRPVRTDSAPARSAIRLALRPLVWPGRSRAAALVSRRSLCFRSGGGSSWTISGASKFGVRLLGELRAQLVAQHARAHFHNFALARDRRVRTGRRKRGSGG